MLEREFAPGGIEVGTHLTFKRFRVGPETDVDESGTSRTDVLSGKVPVDPQVVARRIGFAQELPNHTIAIFNVEDRFPILLESALLPFDDFPINQNDVQQNLTFGADRTRVPRWVRYSLNFWTIPKLSAGLSKILNANASHFRWNSSAIFDSRWAKHMAAATGSAREPRRTAVPLLTPSRIAFFQWAIKKGREPEFLTYRRERLSRPEYGVVVSDMVRPIEHNQSDATDYTRWTTFQSVTIFRDTPASPFDPGAFFDHSAPLLGFEAFKHACVFAAAGHWRDFAGASAHEELKDPAPNSVP